MKPSTLKALAEGDFENAIISETPGGIERQEAEGQEEFVNSSTLPKECIDCSRKQFESMGIVFGKEMDDGLFIECELPDGWEKIPTDHSMWSKLVDDKGRERARIFYKAAFYDRIAELFISRRFCGTVQPVGGWDNEFDSKTSPREAVVMDCEKIVWRSEPLSPNENMLGYELNNILRPLAIAWLKENYPDWENPLAYWD